MIEYFSSLNKETMTDAKKHKIKNKNRTHNDNIICAIVISI